MLGEFGLIERLTRTLRYDKTIYTGVGDDAAVLCGGDDWRLLLTTDMIVEGTHFNSDTPPEFIGRKALAVNLSDIAAMGGLPWAALVAAGIPRRTPVRFIERLYRGLKRQAAAYRVNVVGGDTVRADRLTITVTLLGWVEPGREVLRSGARLGDQIFVTGRLGGSLRSGRHLSFTPRVREARAIVQRVHPTAMMDLSDGLASDLRQLAKASRVGARVFAAQIPKAPRVRSAEEALCDGEDFELLFTVPATRARRLDGQQVLGVRVTQIGEIVPARQGVTLVDARGRARPLPAPRFHHF